MKIKKRKLYTICNHIDNGIIVLNRDLEVLFWNKWLEIRTNIPSVDVVGKNLTSIYTNIDKNRLKRKIFTALKLNSPTFYTPQTSDYLIDIELKNVAEKVLNKMQQSVTIAPFDTADGLVALYIYDVTILQEINHKLKIAKQELKDKNNKLSLILDATMESIIVFKDNLIVDCNKEALKTFHKKEKNELLNKTFDELLSNTHTIYTTNPTQNLFASSMQNSPLEAVIHRDDKSSFHAILNIKDTFVDGQAIKIVTIVDINELKQKDRLIAEQTKLAAMGEMITNIAHQWRQPLNIISITTSSLSLKKELNQLDDNLLKESLKLITNTTNHLSETIDTFSDFLKKNKEKSSFSLNGNIQNTLNLVDSFFKDFNIDIETELDYNIYLNNISNEFSQAFINILNNAKDAINSNLSKDEPRIIKVITKILHSKVEIIVCDNANGIKKEIIDKIFEPYFTTKHSSQGTGLGLYIAKKIITSSMYGDISVSNGHFSHKDKEYFGAIFKIILPTNLD